ncbi:hypothetical protein ACH9D2_18335 [Kocuria sp. M4R2S49]|uniref:hypothetical protein n=1 Tax=Kocuria rhizosphaericola TaxID=3376284 RepID=UPI0037AE8461
MAAAAGENWWRRTLAIGFLSFAALGLAGCDESGSGGEENMEQEAPAGEEETPDGEGPREGEGPAEQDEEQEDDG